MRMMIISCMYVFVLGCGPMGCSGLVQTEGTVWPQNTSIPDVMFNRPRAQTASDYLGLEGDAVTFTLSQVKAEIVIVEIFNWDCHFCQRQAPQMDRLYDLLASKGLSDRIKIVGIGATDSDLEVSEYQKWFKVPFPLISDPDYKSYGIIGRLEIPSISVFKRDAQGALRLVYSRSREQRTAEAMLKDILSATGS